MIDRFLAVRRRTRALCEPLEIEDYVVQGGPEASPARWHLGHTTWFFEAMLLARWEPRHRPRDARWGHQFNSYYESLGPRHERARRGELSRPTVREVLAWRDEVDARVVEAVAIAGAEARDVLALGIAHEEQHQELLLTDLQLAFWVNPLRPVYAPAEAEPAVATQLRWTDHPGGLVEIGHAGDGFAFDNEGPRHRVWLSPHRLADRLVTVGEWRAFVADGGYRRPELWLSDGWAWVRREAIAAPLYWEGDTVFTLHGTRPLDDAEPVRHVGGYEADAYARWAGARLPTEAEWEAAAPDPGDPAAGDRYGVAWQWTSSAYGPYPGFRPLAGALGEYNGKFMCNQLVLRGSSSATPPGHTRRTYRNFFHPHERWQVTGVRLGG
ncbi:MAG: ergothioneine biosynthesis protein EgtB [Myxococcota bacterium]